MTRVLVVLLIVVCTLEPGKSIAKPNFRKELGLKSCNDCHNEGHLKTPSVKKMYLVAEKHIIKIKKQEGKFKETTTCYDCHEGESLSK